jgi:lysozyme
MSALEILIELIKKFEGCCLKAYKCPAGIWTIGWGQTGKEVCEGLTWTQTNADNHLHDAASHAIDQLIKSSPVLLDDCHNRIAALADFVYNLGIGNYNSSTLKKHVDSGEWSAAKQEILRWNKAGGHVLAGLTRRRQAEANLL